MRVLFLCSVAFVASEESVKLTYTSISFPTSLSKYPVEFEICPVQFQELLPQVKVPEKNFHPEPGSVGL